MIDMCTCCNGCSSKRQLSSYPRYSFPKKLLVALSIVVIIAMCLMPTEARPSLEHKKRHRRPDSLAHPTKDTAMRPNLEHKRRHQNQRRLENLTQLNKKTKRPKNSQTDIYYSETKKIATKVKNTRRFFNDDRKHFNQSELKEYKNTIPDWLPSVNFVEIHYHDYRSNRSRKIGSTIPERKYTYLMPKLFKSLVEYKELFERLKKTELDFPDEPLNSYKKKRKNILKQSLEKLEETIKIVNESMGALHLTIPSFNKNKRNLSLLPTKVGYTECIKNDYLALRGYGNLLTNWFMEFKCPNGKQLGRSMCQKFDTKLKQRSNSRKKTNTVMKSRLLSAT